MNGIRWDRQILAPDGISNLLACKLRHVGTWQFVTSTGERARAGPRGLMDQLLTVNHSCRFSLAELLLTVPGMANTLGVRADRKAAPLVTLVNGRMFCPIKSCPSHQAGLNIDDDIDVIGHYI